MINENSIDFFNSRLTFDYTKLKDLTPAQRDRIRNYGSQAETLLKNRDLAMFIHHFKFEISDMMISVRAHNDEANAERIALANQLSGIDSFINSLKSAVYKKNKILKAETGNTDSQP